MSESTEQVSTHLQRAAQILGEAALNPLDHHLLEMTELLTSTAREADQSVESSAQVVGAWLDDAPDEQSKDAALSNLANLLQMRATEFAGVQGCFSALFAIHQAREGARRERMAVGASFAAVLVAILGLLAGR